MATQRTDPKSVNPKPTDPKPTDPIKAKSVGSEQKPTGPSMIKETIDTKSKKQK